ncbi:hypothetical protein [Paenibacillus oceani]|uniref:Uncharacterized protein n=1 Tax=Paenibacillus oceani TaxID=2772510 RepID=A0A927CFC7_9BACL|nr:hypothetical protein [Paenibacillus oceani]MBD2864941.1 hypothetical protein [Paenibacillus oceani]
MAYHVLAKENQTLHTLLPEEINDMDYDLAGRVVVFGNDGQVYYLIVDASIIND